MNNRELKEILKNYKFFLFNQKISGQYNICETMKKKSGLDLSFEIEDEEKFINDLKESAELLKEYPNNGSVLYELIMASYFRDGEKQCSKEIASLNESTKTKYRWQGINVMLEVLDGKKLLAN